MSIKISAVSFLDSESLKLHLMPMGVLQLSEIWFILTNSLVVLQAVMITWEVFLKKTLNDFLIYMSRQNYHKGRFSVMDEYDFLTTGPTNPA